MVAAGVDIESTSKDGSTAMLIATKAAQKEVLRALIQASCDLTVTDNESKTCVHHAVEKGDQEMVQLFIDKLGEKKEEVLNVPTNMHPPETPLDIAQREGFQSIAELLLENGAVNLVEDDSDMDETQTEQIRMRAFHRVRSQSRMFSKNRTPIVVVKGGGILNGTYTLQDDEHNERGLFLNKDETLSIRWSPSGVIKAEYDDEEANREEADGAGSEKKERPERTPCWIIIDKDEEDDLEAQAILKKILLILQVL
eukprot:UN24197